MTRRSRKKGNGLFDLIAEVTDMLFEHVAPGWSLLLAGAFLFIGAIGATKCTVAFLPLLIFVMVGVVPALITLLAAWKSSRKKGVSFFSFGSGVDMEYEAHLDAVFKTPSEPPQMKNSAEAVTIRPQASSAPVSASPTAWTLQLLRELEWRRFELLIEGLFRHQNDWRAEGGAAGADGGIDLLLYVPGESKPTAAVQCKAYRSKQVGVSIVRELYGVMAAAGIPHGMVFTCGEFSAEAQKFAENKSVDLVSGAHLLALIHELSPSARENLLREITAGDYITPTCPACRVKMVERSGSRGIFWGCANYPKCRQTLHGAT